MGDGGGILRYFYMGNPPMYEFQNWYSTSPSKPMVTDQANRSLVPIVSTKKNEKIYHDEKIEGK